MKCHIIDFDIILKIKQSPYIVHKTNPKKPLMKISNVMFDIFKSGIYASKGNKIDFNGTTFWLDDKTINNLKVITKLEDLDISKLAISLIEFRDENIVSDLEYKFDMNIFKNIKNTSDDIYIICSKNVKAYYLKLISNFEKELYKIGLKVKDYYYISETYNIVDTDLNSFLKSKIVLQHLLGYRTDDKTLTNNKVKEYNTVNFYDNDYKSLQTVCDINKIIEKYLINTDSNIKLDIKDKIKNLDKLLYVNEYTYNNLNMFITKEVEIKYSNIIKNFENYNKFNI